MNNVIKRIQIYLIYVKFQIFLLIYKELHADFFIVKYKYSQLCKVNYNKSYTVYTDGMYIYSRFNKYLSIDFHINIQCVIEFVRFNHFQAPFTRNLIKYLLYSMKKKFDIRIYQAVHYEICCTKTHKI